MDYADSALETYAGESWDSWLPLSFINIPSHDLWRRRARLRPKYIQIGVT